MQISCFVDIIRYADDFCGFKLLYDVIPTLIFGSELELSLILILVCIITIVTKLTLFLYTNSISKKIDNILLKTNVKDHRNDCLVTTCTLISTLLRLNVWYYFDSIAGKYDGIQKVLNIYFSPVGYKYMIFITIAVDGNMTTFNSHNLADSLEKDVDKLSNVYDTIVHVEPM